MTDTPAADPKEFTGRHMWYLAIGFFGVIIAVNITLAVLSSATWTGLVVSNSYVASQEFEDKRIAHEAQLAAGWDATFTYAPGLATLTVVDAAGKPVELGTATLQINRPVGGHDDQAVTFDRTATGGYVAALTLEPGVWEAMVRAAETSQGPFELHERFSVGAN